VLHCSIGAGIGSEIVLIGDLKKLDKPCPRAIDPAFYRTDADIADLSGLLVGKALRPYQKKTFPLIRRQLGQGFLEVSNIKRALLVRLHG